MLYKKFLAVLLVITMTFAFLGGCTYSKEKEVAEKPLNEQAKEDGISEEFFEYDSKNQKPSDNFDILTSNRWEYDFDDCAYVLTLKDNGEFSNYCACGSPAGYGDMIEHYIYDDETKTLYFYDYEKLYIGQGLVHEISSDKVVIEKYGEVCTYVPY